MPHAYRKKVKYNIRSDNMIAWIVSSLKQVKNEAFNFNLTNYERAAIRKPKIWARHAPIDEIMVVMSKMGFFMSLQGEDVRKTHLTAATMMRSAIQFYRDKDFNKIIELASESNYFSLVGRDCLKAMSLYSQIINGSLYVPNHDYRTFMSVGTGEQAINYKNLKSVDSVISNIFITQGIADLDHKDLGILYTLRKHDDMPVSLKTVKDILSFAMTPSVIHQRMQKCVSHGYVSRTGTKHNMTYSLTSNGWQIITQARNLYFQGVRFWDKDFSLTIEQTENERTKSNGEKAKVKNQTA